MRTNNCYSSRVFRSSSSANILVFLAAASLASLPFAAAKIYQYSNLHRDTYLNLLGQSAPFDSKGQSILEAALKEYSTTFVKKFEACIGEFDYGKVISMSKPKWTVYSQAKPNVDGDGYVQRIRWTAGSFIFSADEDITPFVLERCTRRSFNYGKSEFVPLLQEADADGKIFDDVEKARIFTLSDSQVISVPSGGDEEEEEGANGTLADYEIIQDDDASTKNQADGTQTQQSNKNLERCPVKLRVDCKTEVGEKDCNELPRPDKPDCKEKVLYTYDFKVIEEIRLKSAIRYRKESLQGCDNNFKGCPVREYLKDFKGKYVRVGTDFNAWELVCEDTRHDTRFEIIAERETFYGSNVWVECVISDDYEDTVWTKNIKASYLDLITTNKATNKVDVVTKEPKAEPIVESTRQPTRSPSISTLKKTATNPPTASPTSKRKEVESEGETFAVPENTRCDQLSLEITCTGPGGIDCNRLSSPIGDVSVSPRSSEISDPCIIDVDYNYSVKNIGTTGSLTFSKLLRRRDGAPDDIDFLQYFDDQELVLGQSFSANVASMTETVSMNVCESQTLTTTLLAESTMEGGAKCNNIEEYVLRPQDEIFDISMEGSEVSKEDANYSEAVATAIGQSMTSAAPVATAHIAGTAACLMFFFCCTRI